MKHHRGPNPAACSRPMPGVAFSRLFAAVALATTLAITTGCTASSSSASNTTATYESSGVVYRFEIPIGTEAALDRGEIVDVMPNRLDIKVGDAVEIVNQDDRAHNVGLFYVGEGETVSQVFPSVAEFSDACSVSSSGDFTINVS